MQGCQYRMTSYDQESGGPDFSPAHGIQLQDPRLFEYVGAPESARLLSPSPEYWLHYVGHEKTLAAALQLQHDVGLILSNVQVLQQFVTSLNRTFPADAMQRVVPSCRVRRAVHSGFAFRICLSDSIGQYVTALMYKRHVTVPDYSCAGYI